MKSFCMFLVAGATALAAAGCGGGDGAKQAAAPGTPANPAHATRPAERPTSEGAATTKPGYAKLLERQGAKPRSRFTPCNLVTRSEAGRIIDAPVDRPVEAPLGPTCIYR